MANADMQFNIAKGRVAQYFSNVDTNSPSGCEIHVVPIETTGLEADATLADYDDLASLLAASNNEQTTMGRKYLVGSDITITVDDSNDRVDLDVGDITWSAASGNACSKLLFCYDPDGHGSNTDSTVIPLLGYVFAATPDGSDIVVAPNAVGLIRFT